MASVYFDPAVGGDGSTVTDDTNPTTGLDAYGYTERLVPSFTNVVNIADYTRQRAVAASGFADAAAASAASALNAPGTNATSTTSLAIGTGSKVFTIQTGKAYVVGQTLVAASASGPSNFMIGQVTAHNSGTGSLTLNVTTVGGSGTKTDWVISMGVVASSTLPSQAGANGKVLGSNGTVESWVATLIPANNLSELTASAATVRANIGVTIGTHVQAFHANHTAFAGLSLVADRLPYANGTGTLALATFTAAARALLDDADATAMRATLGVVIGTDVQAQNAKLSAFAGLTGAADKLAYFSGASSLLLADFTAFARTLLDDANAGTMRGTLGAAASGANTDITSLGGLTTALSTAQGGTGLSDLSAVGGRSLNVNAAGSAIEAKGYPISGMALCTLSGSSLTVVWTAGEVASISRTATGMFTLTRANNTANAADWACFGMAMANGGQGTVQENYASRSTAQAFLQVRDNGGGAQDYSFVVFVVDRPAS